MTAIAAPSVAFGDTHDFAPHRRATARIGDSGAATPLDQAPDQDDPVETIASAWRSPCFYLAFIAGAVLVLAVGIIFAWRAIARRGRSSDTSTAASVGQHGIAAPSKHR